MNSEMPLTAFETSVGDTEYGKTLVTRFPIFGVDFPKRNGKLNE